MTLPTFVTMNPATPAELAQVGHWAGSLKLCLAKAENKTVLTAKQQKGPYTVQRALYPEEKPNHGICHLILLHPPGGLVEGDTLGLSVECLTGSHALITTPSAGKVYQCAISNAAQTQTFLLQAGAKLEWFPQEIILFDKSLSTLTTTIDLIDDAKFTGWEIACLGRQIANDFFQQGRVVQSIQLRRDGKPLMLERTVVDASNNALRSQNWGLADQSVYGTFIMSSASMQHVDQARALVDDLALNDCRVGITLLDDVLVCRGLSNQSRHLKKVFSQIWMALRLDILGVVAHEPRIWST